VVAHHKAGVQFFGCPRRAGSGAQSTLFCPLKSRAHLPIGKPIAFVSNWKVLLARPANRLSRWSNAVADDFVNRLAARAEIKKVGHCPKWAGHGSGRASRPSCMENASELCRNFPYNEAGASSARDQQTVNSVPSANIELLAKCCLSVTRHASGVKSWPMIGKLPPTPRARTKGLSTVSNCLSSDLDAEF
jgi:hypothetical protein